MLEVAPAGYIPAPHAKKKFFQIFKSHFKDFLSCWNEQFGQKYGYYRVRVEYTVSEFLKCGDPWNGFDHLECPSCHSVHLVLFACKRKVCPSVVKNESRSG